MIWFMKQLERGTVPYVCVDKQDEMMNEDAKKMLSCSFANPTSSGKRSSHLHWHADQLQVVQSWLT